MPSRSESAPVAPCPRARPMASISSKKMMAPVSFLRAVGEEVAHPRGADADVGVHEVGAREREEGHAGLAGHGLRQQGLPGARRAVQDHAVRHPGADLAEALGLASGTSTISWSSSTASSQPATSAKRTDGGTTTWALLRILP